MTISVCLVDDQTLVRQGIRSLLELSDDIRVAAEAVDGAQAIEVIPQAKPDVVLLDMRMPGMSGLDVLNALAQKNALPPTIILTTFDYEKYVFEGSRQRRWAMCSRIPRPGADCRLLSRK